MAQYNPGLIPELGDTAISRAAFSRQIRQEFVVISKLFTELQAATTTRTVTTVVSGGGTTTGGGSTDHSILSSTHDDTVPATLVAGDILYTNGAGFLTALAIGSNNDFLRISGGFPVWDAITTDDVPEGSNLYYTQARFDTAFAAKTTTDLAEGANLYYTAERVQDEVDNLLVDSATVAWSYNDPGNTLSASVVAGGVDHGGLAGLADDDHAQYFLLAGRAGGQIAYGGINSGDDLTLISTFHATKGTIFFGATGTHVFDEVNGRWGYGTASPSYDVHVSKAAGGNITIESTAADTNNFLRYISTSATANINLGRSGLAQKANALNIEAANDINFYPDGLAQGSERVIMTSTGVGIGIVPTGLLTLAFDTSAAEMFRIQRTSTLDGIRILNFTGANGSFVLQRSVDLAAWTDVISLHETGFVGVGTATTPDTLVHIEGGAGGIDIMHLERSSGVQVDFYWSGSGGDASFRMSTTGNTFALGVDGNDFKISDNTLVGTNDRFTIDSTGNIGFGTNTHDAFMRASATTTLDNFFYSSGSVSSTSTSSHRWYYVEAGFAPGGASLAAITGFSFISNVTASALTIPTAIGYAHRFDLEVGFSGVLTSAQNFRASNAAINGGSTGTIVTLIGFFTDDLTIGTTNNWGFRGAVTSGTGKWNLYMDGTAPNYLKGNLSIGSASVPASATQTLSIFTGTAPSASVTDGVAVYSADTNAAAGKAGLHIRTEDGTSHVFGHNTGIGTLTGFGTSAVNVVSIASGTAPTTSPADVAQLWVADRGATAGKAGFHIRSEDGTSHVFSDRVGIGTTSPNYPFHVYRDDTDTGLQAVIEQDGTGDASLAFRLTGVLFYAMGVDNSDSDKFKFGNNVLGSATMFYTIDSSGNFGIGTETPDSRLHVVDNCRITGDIYQDDVVKVFSSVVTTVANKDLTVTLTVKKFDDSASANTRFLLHIWAYTTDIQTIAKYTPVTIGNLSAGIQMYPTNSTNWNPETNLCEVLTNASGQITFQLTSSSDTSPNNQNFAVEVQGIIFTFGYSLNTGGA